MGADVQALEADVAVFLVGVDKLGVLAPLEQGAQPGIVQPAAQVGVLVPDDEFRDLLVVRSAAAYNQVAVVEVGGQRVVTELLAQAVKAFGLAFLQGFQGLAVDRALGCQFIVAGFGRRGESGQSGQEGEGQQPARILSARVGRVECPYGLGLELDHQSATVSLRPDSVRFGGDPSSAGQRERADP